MKRIFPCSNCLVYPVCRTRLLNAYNVLTNAGPHPGSELPHIQPSHLYNALGLLESECTDIYLYFKHYVSEMDDGIRSLYDTAILVSTHLCELYNIDLKTLPHKG